MFFNKEYEYTIMEPQEKIGAKTRHERWATFAYLKGLEEGLSAVYAINFGYIISSFIGGMGVDAGTDIYFQIGIDDAIFDIYEDCRQKFKGTEEELVKEFFEEVLNFYKSSEGACKYEKAVFGHNIRVATNVKEWFNTMGGVKKTVVGLLVGNIPSPHIVGKGSGENISFRLTYSQEEEWYGVDGDDDPSKLRTLLE